MAPSDVEVVKVQPPESIKILPEEERTLLGELLFLKVWHLLKRNAEPKITSAKVVGILLQLPLTELQQLVAVPKKFQERFHEALAVVGVQIVTDGPEGKALPAPPLERQGQLLYLALKGLVAGDHSLCSFLSAKLMRQLGAEVMPCLVDEKKLRAAMKSMTRSWERDLKEQEAAQTLLKEFEALEPQARAEELMKAGQESGQSTKAKTAQLLKAARKVAAEPQVVGKMIAQAFLASGQSLTLPLVLLLEECSVSREELAAFGARLPKPPQEKGEKQQTRSASRAPKRGRDAEKRAAEKRRASADGRGPGQRPMERVATPSISASRVASVTGPSVVIGPREPREPGRQLAAPTQPVAAPVTALAAARSADGKQEAGAQFLRPLEASEAHKASAAHEAARSRRSASAAPVESVEAPRPGASAPSAPSARAASAEPARQELRKSTKRKGHVWSPMTDAFEAARKQNDETEAKAEAKAPKAKSAASSSKQSEREKGQAAQLELHLQLQALAESKLRAVESEDYELAQKLKQQEQELQRLCTSKSWAALVTPSAHATAARPGSALVFRKNVGPAPKAGPALRRPSAAPAVPAPAPAVPSGAGKLVFVLTAPGELTPETFKATTTHVARRDALARIATAALWRGRGLAWDDIHEIVFIFEDYRALHMTPRFVASCPVPSEYHLIMVLQRALEGSAVPGLKISAPDRERFLGGHIDDTVARFSRAGPTSVVLLHETYPQSLGLYDQDLRSDAGETNKRSLVFFLGAVKDMTPEESRAVVRACRTHEVPCVEANLGQQAEFTSKIIDVLHGHHEYRRLAPAVARARRAAAGAGVAGAAAGDVLGLRSDGWFSPRCGGGRQETGRTIRDSALLHLSALVFQK